MRILIVHNILNDSRSVSGVMTEYAHMANAWVEMGHQADFLVAKAGWPQFQRLAPKSRLVSSDGFFDATGYLSQTWRYLPAYAYRMFNAHWVRLPCRYDIIYASSQFVMEVYVARVLARRQRAKLVVKVQHVLAGQATRKGFFDRLFLWAERKSARWINKDADLLLALSSTVASHYHQVERSLGLRPTPILPSGCGIDLERLADVATEAKEFDVVFLGRLHEQKGVFELPHVWRRIVEAQPGARLLVIGEGPHRHATEQMFERMRLNSSVVFTGGIGEAEKNKLLGRSRVGLSLSYEEGWGLSITEFMALGLPVVAYELPVFEEVFPGHLELAPPHDMEAAASKVLGLLGDDQRRLSLGLKSKEFVARYDYRNMAQAELAKLSAVLEEGGSMAPSQTRSGTAEG
jgi:glycosyltransferase involved in cell wall biosynthesis